MEGMEVENEEEIIFRRRRERGKKRAKSGGKQTKKVDLLEELTEEKLKLHTKFSKKTIQMLANTLKDELILEPRGCPLSPENTVVIGLIKLASGSLNRIMGLVANRIHRETVRLACNRFVDALFNHRETYIKPPTVNQMGEVEYRMWLKYGLKGLVMGVDGVHFKFEGAPRSNLSLINPQDFWCRKQDYTINALVMGDDEYTYFVDVRYPGSAHDSRVWNTSEAKMFVEGLPKEFVCAGDSGYPISNKLVIPYSRPEASQDNDKALFNGKLSQARTEFTEVKFGRAKNQWRALRCLRGNLENSQRLIVACFILRNIARQEKETILEETRDSDSDDASDDDSDGDNEEDWKLTQDKIQPRTEYVNDDPALAQHLRDLETSVVEFPRVLDRGPLSANAQRLKRLKEGKQIREAMRLSMEPRQKSDRNIRPV